MQPQEITLKNGRRVMKGMNPITPAYRGRLQGARSMRKRSKAAPASCFQSGKYALDMYFNSQYGCCTGVAWVEILNYVYGIFVPEDVAMAAFRAAGLLNGANILDVLNFAETYPIVVDGKSYEFGATVTLDNTDPDAIMSGISSNKAVYWGIDAGFLQQCVRDVSGWVAPIITEPQTNYDHAVFSPDYGTLDAAARYINQQRGATVTIGSLDPQMLVVTVDTWDTLGIVPLRSASGKPLTICNTTGEAHVIESFPMPAPAPVPTPTPVPTPGPCPRLQAIAEQAFRNVLADPAVLGELRSNFINHY